MDVTVLTVCAPTLTLAHVIPVTGVWTAPKSVHVRMVLVLKDRLVLEHVVSVTQGTMESTVTCTVPVTACMETVVKALLVMASVKPVNLATLVAIVTVNAHV